MVSSFDSYMTLLQQDKADLIRPKRKYEKKPKVLPSSAAATPQQTSPAALPVFNAKDLNQYDFPSSDEEPLSQVKITNFSVSIEEKWRKSHVLTHFILF